MSKAIETIFADNRFHSRLAARWAVFFDLLDIKYVYRPRAYKLTELNDQVWSPDFYIPDLEQDLAHDAQGIFIELFERQPDARDLEAPSHFSGCTGSEVYAFYGDVAQKGHYCSRVVEDDDTVPTAELAQRPFCGCFYIGSFRAFKESERTHYSGHACCPAECAFVKPYDIDSAFMDYMGKGQVMPSPTSSPMLDLARHAAHTIRFDARDALDKLEGLRAAIKVLSATGNFANNALMKAITDHARTLSQNPNCPRYWEPWYVKHVAHKQSGNIGPCPCSSSSCRRDIEAKGRIADLDNMPSSNLQM
ncbi:MAG TPA: hypothetical protein VGG97_06955 [Bryobacteraceae bacterium]|jgi:hypothetical protein